ncbi:M15 family metallopeptidase [Glutamicibacter mishrai]|uniref:M15 family metallopeptidase n=1 Tax=Glutamicibacter mishrai TaxID=1775880 RepID=UPI0020CE55FD|nr:M15 family metallopeptidase [Glutamicibacter mishrai]UTT38947.1 M15 family metallopeptidase [Glutamicibacter mishrai]
MRLASALTGTVLASALLLSAVPAALAAPADDLPAVESSELSDASSLLALINPTTQLSPVDYTPTNLVSVGGTGLTLRPEAADAVEDLIADARAAGHSIKLLSAYRSYSRQAALFNQYQSKYGTAYAERISARPGTSEHQLGLAADLGYTSSQAELKEAFGQTPAGIWIAEHANDYGLIIRYPQGKEEITGYKYEPWHVRYIGKEHAKALAESGAETYEEYVKMLSESLKAPKAEASAVAGEEEAPKEAEKDSQKDAKKAGHGVVKEDDLLVLRFLPPYRDWGFGFTEK